MAADSDGSGESLTTVVTCEGDLQDPDFPAKFELILDKLRALLYDSASESEARERLCVRKLEPWNSVRVTLAIPRDAALRLRQLASEGSQQLRALGILSVQVEGDQVISLRLAGRFGQEPQEIVLRTGPPDAAGASTSAAVPDAASVGVVSGLTRILAGGGGAASTSSQGLPAPHHLPSTSAAAASAAEPSTSAAADKVQFRSPNVVCPTDTQVPKVPAAVAQPTPTASGSTQRNYNGPFPFASMTHAAQAIHSRESQSQAAAPAGPAHPFTQPPPPYPSQPAPVVKASVNPNSPTVAMSSPLLVNLLQNDGVQVQNKMLPPGEQRKLSASAPAIPATKSGGRLDEQLAAAAAGSDMDTTTTNSAFIQTPVAPPAQQTAIKYPPQMVGAAGYSATPNNSTVPTPNPNIIQPQANTLVPASSSAQALGVRPVGPRLPQQFVQQKVNTQVPVRPVVQQQPSQPLPAGANAQGPGVRLPRPAVPGQKFPAAAAVGMGPGGMPFGAQFPRQSFRGQLNQYGIPQQQPAPQVQQQPFQQNFQQFPSPPPYPRQRMETVRPGFQDISRYQQQRMQQSSWQPQNQFQQMDPSVAPVGQPMPNLTGLSQLGSQNLQPIAQPMPHLGSLNSVLESSLSNITPSLTDLSKTDLDSLLPSLEGELDSTPDIPDIPESLTSTGKRRQYLINPLTGVLEPMPSDSSGSESDTEEGKEATDIFNDFNSPLNDRSNSIYSDEDTCSTTISRKFDTTDQSDSEATVKSTNSENSVKSHQRIKTGKNRDRNRDSPGLKKNNKDLPTEKIKLRLKLEKSEPVSQAYKVDISFINTQQPKRATQNVARPAVAASPSVPCPTVPPAGEELRVPPLHISLRGRNSVVINSEKKKKYPKLNPDGTVAEVKKSKKTVDGMKVKRSLSAKELSVKSGSLLPTTLTKNETALSGQKAALMKPSDLMLPSTSTLEQKHSSEVKLVSEMLKGDVKTIKSVKTSSDLDDLPLKHRMREPGEILPGSMPVKPLIADIKKSKKSNKFNHMDLYREQNLLTGGHLVDDYKSHKKPKNDEKTSLKNPHKSSEHCNKLNSHFRKDKIKDKAGKERSLPGHVGEIRRGSDSDVVKGLKRHADSNGLSHTEKKRRLSQSEGKSNATTVTESQGVNKSVKLKSSPSDGHLSALSQTNTSLHQAVVGSTNVGTISSMTNKSMLKSGASGKLQKPVTKVKRDKVSSFVKTKEGSFKSKDLNRDKTYSQNVAEKLAKQLPLPIGVIDMEAKFKQSLLESSSELPRRHTQLDRKSLDSQKLTNDVSQLDRVTDLVQTLSDRELPRGEINQKASEFPERQKSVETVVVDTRQKSTEQESKCAIKEQESPDRKSTETELPQTQRLDDKQAGRSPNSGGQGEDSGIESMDALSEKSPNQASQSPHSHNEITLTDPAVNISGIKTIKSETKLENGLPDMLDIEEQLAKMDGLPTLNGDDISHMIKTEPFMKTETLLEKLEGTEGKDLNENKEHVKEAMLDECCGSVSDLKVQKTTADCKIEISDLPLTVAMQESLKQGNISVTSRSIDVNSGSGDANGKEKSQPDLEISLVSRKFCDEQKSAQKIDTDCKTTDNLLKNDSPSKTDAKDLDFDPLPIRRKPPLYTYSNPEKQSRDSDSPIPNLSDLDYDNSDSNSECSELKSKISQKAATVTRRRKQNLDNIQMNDSELDACIEAMNTSHYMTDLTGFKKNDIVKKTPKSLLEQLLIEIPSEISDKQVSSTSPSVSEKSLNTSKSSIRTRSSSKLNSPDISESSKSEKSLKTPRHSPVILKQDSPANSPVLCSSKASPKSVKATLGGMPGKRKRQESESSTQSNVSLDEAGNNTRNKKARKCSENAAELIKACMGVDNVGAADSGINKTTPVKPAPLKDAKKTVDAKNNKLGPGLLRKTQLVDLESSDSDEPLIEIAGKVRNKHVATRNKLNSTKSNIPTPLKPVPVVSKVGAGAGSEEKTVGTRRSVRNNAPATAGTLKTRSKLHQQLVGDKGAAASGVATTAATAGGDGDANNRRKTRSAVSDDIKRRRNSKDDPKCFGMIRHLLLMSGLGGSCTDDCSGRGECLNGTCLCEIRYSGDICDGPNFPYHAGIGGGFLLVALVCAIQLMMSVISEYQKLKAPTLLRACRITTQKLLYFLAFLACIIRGAYFTSPSAFKEGWTSSLLSAYYPILMSGSSLIVCFWAEVFHLRDIRWETPQFLSKSFLGFVTFNIINYSLLLAEFITTQIANTSVDDKNFFTHIFNGCYAVLMFIVVIFFLIYGVEVYFKVRGGFLKDTTVTTIANNRKTAEDGTVDPNAEVQSALFDKDVPSADALHQQVNTSQLHQSRFGLLSQAFMLIIIVGFLFSETLSEFWKKKVPVYSRNWHDVVFRVVEIGVALWFPCVLWNCMSPAELWILNPRKLITRLDLEPQPTDNEKPGPSTGEDEAFLNKKDCWICYDGEKNEPLIQPCQCTGDVSSVHHDCLKRWLMESSANSDSHQCKVCGHMYNVQHTTRLDWERGFTSQHWGSTAVIVTCMCVAVAGAWVVIQLFEDPYIRMISASVALLVIYVCIRFLGVNTVDAYQRAKVGALNIVGGTGSHVATISETVAVDIPKAQPQTAI